MKPYQIKRDRFTKDLFIETTATTNATAKNVFYNCNTLLSIFLLVLIFCQMPNESLLFQVKIFIKFVSF